MKNQNKEKAKIYNTLPKEEVSEFLRLRGRARIMRNKKGRGSYDRKSFKNGDALSDF